MKIIRPAPLRQRLWADSNHRHLRRPRSALNAYFHLSYTTVKNKEGTKNRYLLFQPPKPLKNSTFYEKQNTYLVGLYHCYKVYWLHETQ